MEYMLLDIDEKDRRRTLQKLDLTGLTLDPTPEGRKAIDIERPSSERQQRREWDRLRLDLAIHARPRRRLLLADVWRLPPWRDQALLPAMLRRRA